MSPAEYRTIREGCGLCQQAAADYHNVALRSVHHRGEGGNKIPQGVTGEIRLFDARIERAARHS